MYAVNEYELKIQGKKGNEIVAVHATENEVRHLVTWLLYPQAKETKEAVHFFLNDCQGYSTLIEMAAIAKEYGHLIPEKIDMLKYEMADKMSWFGETTGDPIEHEIYTRNETAYRRYMKNQCAEPFNVTSIETNWWYEDTIPEFEPDWAMEVM